MGVLPFDRIKTIQPGGIVENVVVNGIQDAIIATHSRIHFREEKRDLANNLTQIAGSALSFSGRKLISLASTDGFYLPIDLWNPVAGQIASKITGIRLRVNQAASDQWDMTLWQGDASGVESAVVSHVPNATTGWKNIDLGPLAVTIQDNFYYYIRVDHNANGGGNQLLEATVMHVMFGGTP